MLNEGILKYMAEEGEDAVVLSFHDSLLRKSDFSLLEEGRWLNDNLIGFVFEYFEYEEFRSATSEILFISPDVTQFIKLGQGSEVGIFVEPLDFPSHQLLLFAVNSSESRISAGGSHWSVLMYNRKTNMFNHYDSVNGANSNTARTMARNLQPFLNAECVPSFEDAVCPQQQNCSDCGVYVISITEYLCNKHIGEISEPLKSVITPSAITNKRRQLMDLIIQLSQKTK